MIGVGAGEDMIGPFSSGRLARTVANALANAYQAGRSTRDPADEVPQ
jgi:hypothetical protein